MHEQTCHLGKARYDAIHYLYQTKKKKNKTKVMYVAIIMLQGRTSPLFALATTLLLVHATIAATANKRGYYCFHEVDATATAPPEKESMYAERIHSPGFVVTQI
jgi:hypothetical protein